MANFKQTAKYTSSDKKEFLTIVVAQGKSGFNVKASLKSAGKGAPKAKTGARAKFATEKEGKAAFDALVKEAVSKGWAKVERVERNAFTSIPSPSKK